MFLVPCIYYEWQREHWSVPSLLSICSPHLDAKPSKASDKVAQARIEDASLVSPSLALPLFFSISSRFQVRGMSRNKGRTRGWRPNEGPDFGWRTRYNERARESLLKDWNPSVRPNEWGSFVQEGIDGWMDPLTGTKTTASVIIVSRIGPPQRMNLALGPTISFSSIRLTTRRPQSRSIVGGDSCQICQDQSNLPGEVSHHVSRAERSPFQNMYHVWL